jgi:WD40 repeat protein
MDQFLVARDAFNGLLLWKRRWTGPFVSGSGETNSRIVAVGDRVFVVDQAGTTALDAADGEELVQFPTPEVPQNLLYSNGVLLTEARSGVTAFSAETVNQLWKFNARGSSSTVATTNQVFLLRGSRAETGRWGFEVICLDLQQGTPVWQVSTREWASGRKLRIGFVQDGYLALQSHGTLHLLDAANGTHLWSRETQARPGKSYVDERFVGHFFLNGLVWMRSTSSSRQPSHPPNAKDAKGQRMQVQLWDVDSQKLRDSLHGATSAVTALKFSPGSRFVAFASLDNTIKLWDLSNDHLHGTLTGHTDEINCLTFSPDGNTLASGSDDKNILFWDVANASLAVTLKGHTDDVKSVAFAPDGSTLASGSDDKRVILWDVETGKIRGQLGGHSDDVNCVAFSPAGKSLASGSNDRTVRIWNAEAGTVRFTLEGHGDDVNCLAYTADGKTLASGGDDKQVILWDALKGRLRTTLSGQPDDVNGISFAPNSGMLAIGLDDGTVALNDLDGTAKPTLLSALMGAVNAVDFSPDGATLAIAGEASDAPASGGRAEQVLWIGLDPADGELKKELVSSGPWPESATPGKMGCQTLVATEQFIMIPRQSTFIDFQTGEKTPLKFFRGGCGLGSVLANGLVYVHPHACGCFTDTLRGLISMNSVAAPAAIGPRDNLARLEHGPAFGSKTAADAADSRHSWPTYRHDPSRSGRTEESIPARLRERWATSIAKDSTSRAADEWTLRLGNRITAPVAANGKVYVGFPHAHRLVALDAQTGSESWRFTAGGRINAPPTITEGLCLFGANDGWLYCLRADDGRLVWRYQAALVDRRMIAFGQLESVAPLAGSVLVQNGLAYVATGRAHGVDTGIHVLALDPRTGRVAWSKPVGDDFYGLCDFPIGDGTDVYLSNQKFDGKTGQRETADKGATYLLGGKVGLLESSWTRIQLALRKGIQDWSYRNASGQLLAFSPTETFGYRTDGVTGSLFSKGTIIWTHQVTSPAQTEAMILTRAHLFAAGPNDHSKPDGRGGFLQALATINGDKLEQLELGAAPVFDGMAAAYGKLYISTRDGQLRCYEGQ